MKMNPPTPTSQMTPIETPSKDTCRWTVMTEQSLSKAASNSVSEARTSGGMQPLLTAEASEQFSTASKMIPRRYPNRGKHEVYVSLKDYLDETACLSQIAFTRNTGDYTIIRVENQGLDLGRT